MSNTSIIKVGNSKGVIIPARFLKQLKLDIASSVRIALSGSSIVIKSEPRQGWSRKFQAYAAAGEEEQLIPDVFDDEDLSGITWSPEK